jgi:hypothetical protein
MRNDADFVTEVFALMVLIGSVSMLLLVGGLVERVVRRYVDRHRMGGDK